MPTNSAVIYYPSEPLRPLRQGEILSNVVQHVVLSSSEEGTQQVQFKVRIHPFAIVLTQDCDLAQDHSARNAAGAPAGIRLQISNVLLCEIDTAENMKTGGSIAPGSDIWKRIIQNKDERYQYLREVAPTEDALGEGLPPLLIDFKRNFTLATTDLYAQIQNTALRRCILSSPYLEHLAIRYGYFLARVALPSDHFIPPSAN